MSRVTLVSLVVDVLGSFFALGGDIGGAWQEVKRSLNDYRLLVNPAGIPATGSYYHFFLAMEKNKLTPLIPKYRN